MPHPKRIYRFLRSDRVPAWRKAIVYAALAYVVFPFDAIPDLAPLMGWLDDLGVAGAALMFLSWALGDEQLQGDRSRGAPEAPEEHSR